MFKSAVQKWLLNTFFCLERHFYICWSKRLCDERANSQRLLLLHQWWYDTDLNRTCSTRCTAAAAAAAFTVILLTGSAWFLIWHNWNDMLTIKNSVYVLLCTCCCGSRAVNATHSEAATFFQHNRHRLVYQLCCGDWLGLLAKSGMKFGLVQPEATQ